MPGGYRNGFNGTKFLQSYNRFVRIAGESLCFAFIGNADVSEQIIIVLEPRSWTENVFNRYQQKKSTFCLHCSLIPLTPHFKQTQNVVNPTQTIKILPSQLIFSKILCGRKDQVCCASISFSWKRLYSCGFGNVNVLFDTWSKRNYWI